MLKIFLALVFFSCRLAASDANQQIVVDTIQIQLEDFPGAHNPSLIKMDEGFLLIFRYLPDLSAQPWISYIGVVVLNDAFQPISKPQLINTRLKNSKTPSQSEDPRIFRYKGRLYLIYHDNVDIISPATWERRDMFISELFYTQGRFTVSAPLKLVYEEKYHTQLWQKNWVPFEKDGVLLLTYSVNPHEILCANLNTGICYPCYETSVNADFWKWGILRGSTPPQLVDGEYWAFFHSGIITSSSASWGLDIWHYFMGAYIFSADPPFQITKMTPEPIVSDDFYTPSSYYKRVIYPGGFVVSDSFIYVAYGKDDSEIWIATLDKNALKNAMISVEH